MIVSKIIVKYLIHFFSCTKNDKFKNIQKYLQNNLKVHILANIVKFYNQYIL